MFPRQPSPTGYHNTYQLYTMENTRQTILNDYITSQQMQVIPRPDVARGLSPREQPVAIPYPAGARGMALYQLILSFLQQQAGGAMGGRSCSIQTVCLQSSGYLFQTPRSKWPKQICWFDICIGAATSATTQFIHWVWSYKSALADWLPLTSWPLFHPICSPVAYTSICNWEH